VTLKIILRHA